MLYHRSAVVVVVVVALLFFDQSQIYFSLVVRCVSTLYFPTAENGESICLILCLSLEFLRAV